MRLLIFAEILLLLVQAGYAEMPDPRPELGSTVDVLRIVREEATTEFQPLVVEVVVSNLRLLPASNFKLTTVDSNSISIDLVMDGRYLSGFAPGQKVLVTLRGTPEKINTIASHRKNGELLIDGHREPSRIRIGGKDYSVTRDGEIVEQSRKGFSLENKRLDGSATRERK